MRNSLVLLLIGLLCATSVHAQDDSAKPAVKKLLVQLTAKDAKQRIAATVGLARHKEAKTLPALGKALASDKDSAVRLAAAKAMVAIDLEAAVPLLKEGLAGQHEALRQYVVERLGSLRDEDLSAIFRERLAGDKAAKVRVAALEALLPLTRDPASLQAIFDVVGTKDATLAKRVLRWIGDAMPVGGRARLLSMLDKASGERLAQALRALSPYEQIADARRFVAALESKHEAVRTAGFESLKQYSQAHPFNPAKPADKQKAALVGWKRWWADKAGSLATEDQLVEQLVEFPAKQWQDKRDVSKRFKSQLELAQKALVRGLSHKTEAVRIGAAEICEQIANGAMIDPLITHLADKQELDKVKQRLLRALAAICARQEGLSKARRKSVIAAVHAAYQGASTELRRTAVRAISMIGVKEGLATFKLVLLKDPDKQLRSSAAAHMARRGFEQAVETLGEALQKDKETMVRSAAARALSQIEGNKAISALLAAYPSQTDSRVQADILWGVRTAKDARAVLLFLAALSSDDVGVRIAADEGLKEYSGLDKGFSRRGAADVRAEGVKQWQAWWGLDQARRDLTSDDPAKIKRATEALSAGGADSLPVVARVLEQTQKAQVKRLVITILLAIDDVRAAWQLADLLDDADRGVRLAAIEGLRQLDQRSVAGLVASRLKRAADQPEKLALARTLTALGDAASVRGFLLELLDDTKASAAERLVALATLSDAADKNNLGLLREVLAGTRAKGVDRARAQAILGLGKIDDAQARQALLALASGSVESDAVKAIVSLTQGKRKAAASGVLAAAQQSKLDSVRIAACGFFSELAIKEAVGFLTKQVSQAQVSSAMRIAAADALGAVGGKTDAKSLVALASNAKASDQARAAAARGALRLDRAGRWAALAQLVGSKTGTALASAIVEGTPAQPSTDWYKTLVMLAGGTDKALAQVALGQLTARSGEKLSKLEEWNAWLAVRIQTEAAMTLLRSAKVAERAKGRALLQKLGTQAAALLLQAAESSSEKLPLRIAALQWLAWHGNVGQADRLARLSDQGGDVGPLALAAFARLAGAKQRELVGKKYQQAAGVSRAVLAGAVYRLSSGIQQQAALDALAAMLAEGEEDIAEAVIDWLANADKRAIRHCSHALLELARGAVLRPRALRLYATVADRRDLAQMLKWLDAADKPTRRYALAVLKPHAPDSLKFDPASKKRKAALKLWQAWWDKQQAELALGGQLDEAIDGLLHGDASRQQASAARLSRLLNKAHYSGQLRGLRAAVLTTVNDALERLAKDPEDALALARLVDSSRAAGHAGWASLYKRLALGSSAPVRAGASRALRDLALSDLDPYVTLLEQSGDAQVRLYALMALAWSETQAKAPIRARLDKLLPGLIKRDKEVSRPAELAAEAMGLAGAWGLNAAADAIVELLGSSTDQTLERSSAARALGRLSGGKGAIKQLIKLLLDQELSVREAAIGSLDRRTGAGSTARGDRFGYQAKDTAEKRRQSQSEWRKWWRAEQLRSKVAQAIAAHLGSEKPKLETLVDALRKISPPPVGQLIERLLQRDGRGGWGPNRETSDGERKLLTTVLGEFDEPASNNALLRLMADPDLAVRQAAGEAFFKLAGTWQGARPSYKAAGAPLGLRRQSSLVELAWELEQEARAENRRLLDGLAQLRREVDTMSARFRKHGKGEDALLRQAVAIWLGQRKTRSALGLLNEMLADKDKQVSAQALASLQALTGQTLTDAAAWKKWIGDNPEAKLSEATPARQLADLRRLQAIARKRISELSKQRDPKVQKNARFRRLAIMALGLAEDEVGLSELINALEDSVPFNRQEAASWLDKLTGEEFGFRAGGQDAARAASVKQWRKWRKSNPTFFKIQAAEKKQREKEFAQARALLRQVDASKLEQSWKPMASDNPWLRRAAYEAFLELAGALRNPQGLRVYLFENPNEAQRKKSLTQLRADWKAELATRALQGLQAKQLAALSKLAATEAALIERLSQAAKAPFQRRLAAALLAGVPSSAAAKRLVGLLEDRAAGVRQEAITSLRALAGKSFGFTVYRSQGPGGAREKALANWKALAEKPEAWKAPSWTDAQASARLAHLRHLAGQIEAKQLGKLAGELKKASD